MTEDIRRANCDLVRRYIDMINVWDYEGMRSILAPDMVFEMRFPLPGMPSLLRGRDAILEYQRECNKVIIAENLHDLWLETLHSDPGEILAKYRSDMAMADPSIKYANEYFARFTVRNGLIHRFQENYDSHRGVTAFGIDKNPESRSGQNRQTVLSFCQHLSDRVFDRTEAMTADGMTWFVVGRPDRVKNAGTHTFVEVKATTCEEDRVTVEAFSHGTMAGKPYSNQYLMQFVVVGKPIQSVKEFFDQSSVDAFNDLVHN